MGIARLKSATLKEGHRKAIGLEKPPMETYVPPQKPTERILARYFPQDKVELLKDIHVHVVKKAWFTMAHALLDVGAVVVDAGCRNGDMTYAMAALYPDYNDIHLSGQNAVDSLLSASLSTYQSAQGFKLGLPTALAVQYDQRVIDHVYVAADVVQNLAFGDELRLRRPNSFALVPRYERKRYEAAVPLVIHEYDLRRPSLGLMLRLNNVVLGSDNLLSLVSRGGLFGTDVYFRIKWTIFRSPACKGGKKREHRSGAREAMPCKFPE